MRLIHLRVPGGKILQKEVKHSPEAFVYGALDEKFAQESSSDTALLDAQISVYLVERARQLLSSGTLTRHENRWKLVVLDNEDNEMTDEQDDAVKTKPCGTARDGIRCGYPLAPGARVCPVSVVAACVYALWLAASAEGEVAVRVSFLSSGSSIGMLLVMKWPAVRAVCSGRPARSL
ncbi:hypothetical protein NFJ02_20g43390 [Pycnococcus provasolii]